MISEVSIKDYKLHKNTVLCLGKITIFIGLNDTGKSSVVQAIKILFKNIQLFKHSEITVKGYSPYKKNKKKILEWTLKKSAGVYGSFFEGCSGGVVVDEIKRMIGKTVFYSEEEVQSEKNIFISSAGTGEQHLRLMVQSFVDMPSMNTFFVEEPENHLHPIKQQRFCGLFGGFVVKDNKQLVLTTYSEHIIFGFLNLVTKGLLKPEDVVIYYFMNDKDEVKVRDLKINEFGQVDGGLPGFFEVGVDELLGALSMGK